MINYPIGSNLSTLKSKNKSLVLMVLNNMEQVSRAELSRITGLTKTTIKNIANELLKSGIIIESGTLDAPAGRKPVLLEIAENSRLVIGIYIARDFLCANLVNLKGKVIEELEYPLSVDETPQSLLDLASYAIGQLLSDFKQDRKKILGIGIASIGPLDTQQGIILEPPNFRGMKSIPIVSALKKEFGFSVYLDNDMNASAIAEKLYGHARNIQNFIYVGVTNGIGSGLFFHNQLFSGNNGFAGEIGHTTVDIHGERCACGNIGCLELYTSIHNIINKIKYAISLGKKSILSNEKTITWQDVINAVRQGDSLCQQAIEQLIHYLSIGLVNTINTYDPEIIFLGHEIALAGDFLLDPIRQTVNSNLLFRNTHQVSIELSAFRENAPRIGSASLVLDKFFKGML